MESALQVAFNNLNSNKAPSFIKRGIERFNRNQRPTRLVNTKLSFRTYNQLKAQGVVD